MNGFKTVYIDVMEGGRFVCQLPYSYCPLWPIDYEEVEKYVINQRPSLKRRNITLCFSNNRVLQM